MSPTSTIAKRIVTTTVEKFGGLDILVNNVGTSKVRGNSLDVDLDEWDRGMQINVKSMVMMVRFAVPEMKKRGGGSIINIASITAYHGGHPNLLYPTSKAAVVHLSRTMAGQHGVDDIRVNSVSPGFVYTPVVYGRGLEEGVREMRRDAGVLKTEGTGWDVAYGILYLASDEARWVTGITLPIDAGVSNISPHFRNERPPAGLARQKFKDAWAPCPVMGRAHHRDVINPSRYQKSNSTREELSVPVLRTTTFLLAAGLALIAGSAQAQAQGQTLTVASFGGNIDNALRKAMSGFEQKFGVTIRWVPGNTTENAAKVVATKASPEYDVAMLDDVAQEGVSKLGLLAKLDMSVVTNYNDLRKQAKFPSMDGVPIGFNFTGFFYNEPEFKKRGWAPPRSWNDAFRPEFCNHFGLLSPSVSYTLNFVVLLAGGNIDKVPESIAKLGKLKGCVPTLEPSSAKLEEKIQLGEYLVGLHGTVRILPLGVAGYPVKFVIPDEGTALSSTTAAVVIGGKEKLAQEFINWLISPQAQQVLLEEAFYHSGQYQGQHSAQVGGARHARP